MDKILNKILLILLLLLGGALNFLPHLNYDYPMHVDEWVHFTYSKHISDNSPLYFGGESSSLELGFHNLLAVLSFFVPYLLMFKFLASLFTILICLAIFILVRRIWTERAALFSVLFIVLLKSSVLLLGPMFVVPMSLGLFFIPIGLFLAMYNPKSLFLIIASLIIIHPPSAIALFLLINCYLIIERKNVKELLFQQFLGAVLTIPFFLDFFKYHEFGLNYLNFDLGRGFIFIPRFIGIVFMILAILGLFVLNNKGKYVFVAYTLLLLGLVVSYFRFDFNVFIPYRRVLMYSFEAFAIFFGVGCSWIVSRFKKYRTIVLVVFIIFLISLNISEKVDSTKKVYHLIENKDYNDFIWIKENTNGLVLVDPWKAIAFTPIVERTVYTRVLQGPNKIYEDKNAKVWEFFKNNCVDKNFLKNEKVSIVYGNCKNNLKKLRENIYSV